MRAVDLIAGKRAGGKHRPGELRWLVEAFLRDEVPDYQMAAWLMAVCWRGLDRSETQALTLALAESGRRLSFAGSPRPVVDKHSTGGVGDKTTLVLAPMLAAAGVAVAKMSGRGLGHTGGTVDKLESIPGVRLTADAGAFEREVQASGLAIAAQSPELAPGDGRLYALRDVTATVESIPLIASSVMSKKIATGAQVVVLDVKAGGGAFMKDRRQALLLARAMVALGRGVGLPTAAVISAMDEPLGWAIGNALEVEEAVATLRGQGPPDLVELCLTLGGTALTAAGVAPSMADARRRLQGTIDDGTALARLAELVERLGGERRRLLEPGGLPQAPHRLEIRAPRAGVVAGIDALACGQLAMRLGAGRQRKDEAVDPDVGLVLHAKVGDRVARGERLVTLHAREALSVDSAPAHAALAAFRWSEAAVSRPTLILDTLTHAPRHHRTPAKRQDDHL
ncbi:MAG TPA: thymidine phosphorylase [Chloroflexota bacterium]|nr:thymidine phosphorylase [Chloroflexota bacterium]